MTEDNWKEDVIAEIDERFSRNIEALSELQIKKRQSGHVTDAARIGGKIEGYREMRQKAIEAIRMAHTVEHKSLWRRVAEGGRGCIDEQDCCVSTGIVADELTFGSGKLDDHGYWEHPCAACARAAEERDGVPLNTYWPMEDE